MQQEWETTGLSVQLEPVGPNEETFQKLLRTINNHPLVQKYLRGTRHLLLSFDWLDEEKKDDRGHEWGWEWDWNEKGLLFEAFRAIYYDYTHNRSVIVTGNLRQPYLLRVETSSIQPLPTDEEFAMAVEILEQDEVFGSLLQQNLLRPYRPMPPLIETELPDGRVERILAVGLLPLSAEEVRHEIVGVDMVRATVIRFEDGAPPGAIASDIVCEPPASAVQSTTNKGITGQVNVTFRSGGQVIWQFTAIRPSASSGTRGSGIELRNVRYRGRLVLARAHAPILNVRYQNDVCGPYRDWQYEEGMIEAGPALQEVNSFRVTATPPRTILDSGRDVGNFRGTVIYVQGSDLVLVNEMEAGWYRYISEWRLSADGTIRPRFGFSAVANSCTCNRHFHHVYWRFDFDIGSAGNNMVWEYNSPPIFPNQPWHRKFYEIRRQRDRQSNRQWLVMNRSTRNGYRLVPGVNDGTADEEFGVGDVWILRFHSGEFDDGVNRTSGSPEQVKAQLDRFLNRESVLGEDVVLWYAAHFDHAPGGEGSAIVGPTLRPFNW
ncbi:hypothetical protein [Brevibacillus dissolubilis]|uniref:hypothetical protein n=1 Tax=Brevibacillus dissolubilis TaxID=1844116 RepID=UPI0011173FF4|nr:hypothetical protein [Brevibacillus dissolubilis]